MSTAPLQSDPVPGEIPDGLVGRSALRKASLRLVPLIAFGYCAAYMDRVNISFAAVQMNRDLHFSATPSVKYLPICCWCASEHDAGWHASC